MNTFRYLSSRPHLAVIILLAINRFAFTYFDSNRLCWLIDTAIKVLHPTPAIKQAALTRVMQETKLRDNNYAIFQQYLGGYHKFAIAKTNHAQHLASLNQN